MDIKKVLVTGSEGYLGSMLVPVLLGSGYEVVRFDKVLGDDILHYEELREKSKDCDIIIHLAAVVGLKAYDDNQKLAWDVNTIGTRNVIYCDKKVILTSVTGKYEDCDIVTEETKMIPSHDYFISKIESEKMVLDKNGVVLRFGSLYGRSLEMRWDLLVHNLCSTDFYMKLFQPSAIRPLTNIIDAIKAIMFLMDKDSGIYNVVSCNISKMSIAKAIRNCKNIDIEIVEGSDSEKRDYFVSTDKIEKLGFKFFPDLNYNINRIANG